MKNTIANAIPGFNREWAAVTAMRDGKGNVIGWTLQTACQTSPRKFPDAHWDDPHGAAMRALEMHQGCNRAT